MSGRFSGKGALLSFSQLTTFPKRVQNNGVRLVTKATPTFIFQLASWSFCNSGRTLEGLSALINYGEDAKAFIKWNTWSIIEKLLDWKEIETCLQPNVVEDGGKGTPGYTWPFRRAAAKSGMHISCEPVVLLPGINLKKFPPGPTRGKCKDIPCSFNCAGDNLKATRENG